MDDIREYNQVVLADDRIVIHRDEVLTVRNIANICDKHNSFYLGEFCLRLESGGWSNFPAAVFYNPVKHPEGSNYMAFYWKLKPDCLIENPEYNLMVTDGIHVEQQTITCAVIDDKYLLYSAYRHDYQTYNGIVADGGRDYFRSMVNVIPCNLKITDGEFQQIN